MTTLSKEKLSLIHKKNVAILKRNNIHLLKDWLLFYPCGELIPYIIIHNNCYEFIIEERNNIIFDEKCYSESELFYLVYYYDVTPSSSIYDERVYNEMYKMFSLLDFEWANKYYFSLNDENKKYISFLNK